MVSKTNALTVEVANRRNFAVALRVQGLTYREISEAVCTRFQLEPFKYDERDAYKDVALELAKVRRETSEMAGEIRAIELERLDKLMVIAMGAAQGDSKREILPDLDAIPIVLKIMGRRAKLLGLDAPSQIKVEDWRSEVIDLLKTGKITFEQLRQEIGSDLAGEIVNATGIGLLESGEVEEGQFIESTGSVASETPSQ